MVRSSHAHRRDFFGSVKRHPVWAGLGFFLLLVSIAVPVLSYFDTAPMIAVADRLHPQSGWVKNGEKITGHMDLASATKGSMWRSWVIPQTVKDTDLKAYATDSGYNPTGQEGCEGSAGSAAPGRCTLLARRDGYTVRLVVTARGDGSHSLLVVSVADSPVNL